MATVPATIDPGILHAMDKLIAAASTAVNVTLDAVEKDFQSSVQHFVHKPAFTKERAQLKGNAVVGQVFTNDENYYRLSKGTTAHDVGQSGQLMRFHGVSKRNYKRMGKGVMVYQPKSIAGSISSRPGGNLTNYVAAARGPWHVKGIDPRNYDLLIAAKNQPVLNSALASALKSMR